MRLQNYMKQKSNESNEDMGYLKWKTHDIKQREGTVKEEKRFNER